MDDYQEAGQFLSDSLQPAGWLPALFKQVYSKKHLHFQHNDTKIRWYYSGEGGGVLQILDPQVRGPASTSVRWELSFSQWWS